MAVFCCFNWAGVSAILHLRGVVVASMNMKPKEYIYYSTALISIACAWASAYFYYSTIDPDPVSKDYASNHTLHEIHLFIIGETPDRKAKLDGGDIVYYDMAVDVGNPVDESRWSHLGSGVIYSIRGVRTTRLNRYDFYWPLFDKYTVAK